MRGAHAVPYITQSLQVAPSLTKASEMFDDYMTPNYHLCPIKMQKSRENISIIHFSKYGECLTCRIVFSHCQVFAWFC